MRKELDNTGAGTVLFSAHSSFSFEKRAITKVDKQKQYDRQGFRESECDNQVQCRQVTSSLDLRRPFCRKALRRNGH